MPDAHPPYDDDDDDAELELEPVDPEIIAIERQRADRKTDEVLSKIDVDELYREQDEERGLSVDWSSWKQFRFTTRGLLTLTALLAVVMSLFKASRNPCSAVFVLGAVALGAGWYWVLRQERRMAAERARRREEFFASGGKQGDAATTDDGAEAPEPAARDSIRGFALSFSTQQLFIAVTVAAVMLFLLTRVGPENMALTLGFIALLGLGVQMVIDLPPIIVLLWWVMLVFYLAFGAIAALRSFGG